MNRTQKAKFPGRCWSCEHPIDVGDRIGLVRTIWVHEVCAPAYEMLMRQAESVAGVWIEGERWDVGS